MAVPLGARLTHRAWTAVLPAAAVAAGQCAVVGLLLAGRLGDVTLVAASLGALLVAAAVPVLGVSLIGFSVFVADWLIDEVGLLPGAFRTLSEALLAGLALRVLAVRGVRGVRGTPLDGAAALLLAAVLTGVFYGDVPPFRVLLGLRVLFKFPMLFYVLLNLDLGERFHRRAVGALLGAIFLQVPVGILQFASGFKDDRISGTVRSNGLLVVLVVFASCLLIGLFLHYRSHPALLGAAFPLFALPILGEGKAFFFLFPPAVLALLVSVTRAAPRKLVAAVAIALPGLLLGGVLFESVDGNEPILAALVSPSQLLHAQSLSASVRPRLANIAEAHEAVAGSWRTFAVGLGAGSHTFTAEEVQERTSAILFIAPVATRIWEIGYLGLALVLLLHVRVVQAAWRVLAGAASRFWRGVAAGMLGVTAAYTLAMFYTETAEQPLAFTFWLLAAAVLAADRRAGEPPAPA